jgi:hypothetical protein
LVWLRPSTDRYRHRRAGKVPAHSLFERKSAMGKGNNAQKNDKKNKKPKQEKKPASK